MKRSFPIKLFVCAAFVWGSSCSSKAKVNPVNPVAADSISATVEGINENFNSSDTAKFYDASKKAMYISGTNAVNSDKIILILASSSQLTSANFPSGNNILQMLYGQGPGFTADNYYYTYDISGGPSFNGVVTITSISDTNIKGIFSGTLVLEASIMSPAQITKNITNGKFNLNVKNGN